MLCQVWFGYVRLRQDRLGQIKVGYIRLGLVRQVRLEFCFCPCFEKKLKLLIFAFYILTHMDQNQIKIVAHRKSLFLHFYPRGSKSYQNHSILKQHILTFFCATYLYDFDPRGSKSYQNRSTTKKPILNFYPRGSKSQQFYVPYCDAFCATFLI